MAGPRDATGGTLIFGGGFGGSYVARLLGRRSVTIVIPTRRARAAEGPCP